MNMCVGAAKKRRCSLQAHPLKQKAWPLEPLSHTLLCCLATIVCYWDERCDTPFANKGQILYVHFSVCDTVCECACKGVWLDLYLKWQTITSVMNIAANGLLTQKAQRYKVIDFKRTARNSETWKKIDSEAMKVEQRFQAQFCCKPLYVAPQAVH